MISNTKCSQGIYERVQNEILAMEFRGNLGEEKFQIISFHFLNWKKYQSIHSRNSEYPALWLSYSVTSSWI
jgi:hypothetical protein